MDANLRERLTGFFGRAPRHLLAAYLFGSEARNEARPSSDVDVAVLFEQSPMASLMGEALTMEGDLDRELGREVHLVVLNDAPADLVHRVLRDGILLLDRDPSARIRFEVAKRNEFFDLQPILEEYRRKPSARRSS